MAGQLDAVGQLIGGPPIGLIATSLGLRVAFVLVGLMLAPVLVLYLWSLRLMDRQSAALAEESAPA
jgi:DHA3 family tetracycline resistance protein-like MFS transporter